MATGLLFARADPRRRTGHKGAAQRRAQRGYPYPSTLPVAVAVALSQALGLTLIRRGPRTSSRCAWASLVAALTLRGQSARACSAAPKPEPEPEPNPEPKPEPEPNPRL